MVLGLSVSIFFTSASYMAALVASEINHRPLPPSPPLTNFTFSNLFSSHPGNHLYGSHTAGGEEAAGDAERAAALQALWRTTAAYSASSGGVGVGIGALLTSHPEAICTTSQLYRVLQDETCVGALCGGGGGEGRSRVRRAESAGVVLEEVLRDRCKVGLIAYADALRLVRHARGSVSVCADDRSMVYGGDDGEYAAALLNAPPCRNLSTSTLDCQVPQSRALCLFLSLRVRWCVYCLSVCACLSCLDFS